MSLNDPFKMSVKVIKTADNTNKIMKALGELDKMDVLIGIPQNQPSREDESVDDNDSITNAQLLFVHSEGSPDINLPARPTIQPTIEQENPAIIKMYNGAMLKALKGKDAKGDLDRIGIYLVNKVRRKFGSDELAPLSPKYAKRKSKKITKGKKGQTVQQLRDDFIAGNGNPLTDTGQLRKAITYIVANRKKKK